MDFLNFYGASLSHHDEDICQAAAIHPVRDPSNDNPDFDRVAMRQWLAESDAPFDRLATNRTASALADAGVALDWMTEQLATQRITSDESMM